MSIDDDEELTCSQRAYKGYQERSEASQKETLINAFRQIGTHGFTPYECERIVTHYSSAHTICFRLQRELKIVERGDTRTTKATYEAAVLIHRDYATQLQIVAQMEANIVFKLVKIIRYQVFLASHIFTPEEDDIRAAKGESLQARAYAQYFNNKTRKGDLDQDETRDY